MNDHGTEPPDMDKLDNTALQNVLIVSGVDIKQKPFIKQEPLDDDDVLMVSRSTHTANRSPGNLIGNDELCISDNFSEFGELDAVKSEILKKLLQSFLNFSIILLFLIILSVCFDRVLFNSSISLFHQSAPTSDVWVLI